MEFRDILHTKAKSGEKFRFEDLALHTTFDVIGKATFGQSLNAKSEGSSALEHWENMTRAFASTRESWNLVKNFFKRRLVRTEAKKLDAILAGFIRQRFDLVVRENTDLSSKKGLNIMDLILRDSMDEIRQSGSQGLDPTFLADAITQVKTLLVAGSGTTSDTICFTMML
jgi:cytochrome P450